MNEDIESDELLDFGHQLADEARRIAMRYFRREFGVESKADLTPVTVADREIEARYRELIKARFPEHGVVGEEFGWEGEERRSVWVVDPIDGTQAFVTGVPLFGSLIALLVDQVPVFGIIEAPALAERWVAFQGRTMHGDTAVSVSGCTALEDASLFATSMSMFGGERLVRFQTLAAQVKRLRFGTDCYAYGLLASGFVDLVVESDMAPHDFLALVPVVEGAGGRITDWQGRALGLDSEGDILAAATPELHSQALDVLSLAQGSPGTP